MKAIFPRKFIPGSLAIGMAAILSTASFSVNAADAVKRLLDLQLKKGIITQQEYDEFMEASAAETAEKAPVAELGRPARKAGETAAAGDGGTAIINNDTLKVEVFGTVDLAAGYTSKSLVPSSEMPSTIGPWISTGVKIPASTPANMTSQTGIFNGALSPSAWGIRASRTIGDNGAKAFIVLDSAFNPATGQLINQAHNQAQNGGKYPTTVYATSALNGQLFAREAYVGLSDPSWGRLAVGRNNNFIQEILGSYAPLQKASLFTPYGNGVLGGGGGISENSRVDNSIKYQNKFGRVNLGVMYGFGGVGGLRDGAQGLAGNIGYDDGRLGIQLVYEQAKDLLKTATTGCFDAACNSANPNDQISLTAYDQEAMLLAIKYKLSERTRIQAGTQRVKLTAASADPNIPHLQSLYDQVVFASTAYNGTPVRMEISHLGIDHDLTEKLNVGAAYVYTYMPAWSGFTNAHLSQAAGGLNLSTAATSFSGGAMSAFTLLADYKLYKNTDLYAGALYTHYSGNAFSDPSKYVQSIVTAATGVRFKF